LFPSTAAFWGHLRLQVPKNQFMFMTIPTR